MILRRLSLKNFTSYASVEVEFPSGESIAIVGPNGAGKSSLLDAVYYTLYGESLRGGLRDIVRAGQSEMEAELVFETPSGVYKVVRSVSIKGSRHESRARLYKYKEADGRFKLVARGAKEVTREVSRIIGVDKALFTAAYYVRQGEIASLLSMEPAKRKEMVSRLLGLNYFENAYQKLYEVIRRFEDEVADELKKGIEEKKRLMEEKGRTEEEIRNLDEKISEYEARLHGLKKSEMELAVRLSEAEEKLKKVEEFVSRFNTLEEVIRNYEERIRELKEEIGRAEESKTKLEALSKELERLEPYYKARDAALIISNKRGELELILDRIKILEESLAKIPRLRKIAQEYDNLKKKLDVLEKKSRELEGFKATLVEKRRKLGEVEREIKSTRERVNRYLRPLGLKLSDFSGGSYFDVIGIVEKLREKKGDELKRIENEVRELRDALSGLKERENQLLKWIRGLSEIRESRCPLCGSPLTEEHKKELLERYSSELEELRGRIDDKSRRLRAAEEKWNSVRKEYEAFARIEPSDLKLSLEKLVELEAERDNLLRIIKELENKIRRLEEEVSQLREVRRKLEEIEGDYYEYLRLVEEKEDIEKELKERRARLNELKRIINESYRVLGELGLASTDPAIIVKHAKEYEALDKEVEKLRAQALRLEELKEKLERVEERLAETKREREALLPKIKEKEILESKIDELKVTRSNVISRIGVITGRIKELKNSREEKGKELKEIEEKIKRLDEVEKKYRVAEKVLNTLEKIRRAFSKDGAPSKIRARIVPRVERLAREFIQVFDLNIQDIVLSEDFSITVRDGNQLRGIATLSGGEQAIVALSLRLAIARSTAEGTGLLMFDEPTANLDEERRKRLVGALKMLPEMGGGPRQMIIVTHDRDLEDAVGLVYEVKRTPYGSVVVRTV